MNADRFASPLSPEESSRVVQTLLDGLDLITAESLLLSPSTAVDMETRSRLQERQTAARSRLDVDFVSRLAVKIGEDALQEEVHNAAVSESVLASFDGHTSRAGGMLRFVEEKLGGLRVPDVTVHDAIDCAWGWS